MSGLLRALAGAMGFDLVHRQDPVRAFHSNHYLRHNARRLEHLASLGLPLAGRSVLEVGAGIGDHSHFYLDRGCRVTITEAREENLRCLRERYPDCSVQFLDMERPERVDGAPFDVVHCYGLLYHLRTPKEALAFLARQARGLLLLETCVSFGEGKR
jgi:2-polyprenyl-3-methyl-5-hydroxy-6-metoxy-1,4-benzoquinol methylase